jgi:hypothetical protein
MIVASTLPQFTVPRTSQLIRYSQTSLLRNTRTPLKFRRLNTSSTMSLSSPVPIALCGKSQVMATNFASSMEGEGYEGLSLLFSLSIPPIQNNRFTAYTLEQSTHTKFSKNSSPPLQRSRISKIHSPLRPLLLHRPRRRRHRQRILRI